LIVDDRKKTIFRETKNMEQSLLTCTKSSFEKNMMMQKHCEQMSRLEFFSWTLRKKKIIQIMNKKNVQKLSIDEEKPCKNFVLHLFAV
jgi:hypothetical protein